MSNTLLPLDCTTILSDDITIDISNINMSTAGYHHYSTGFISNVTSGASVSTYTINPSMTISSNGNVGIGTISGSTSWNWNATEWEDSFPDFSRVRAMCEQYPGLRIAYEKFVTTYKLVKDDYDSTKD